METLATSWPFWLSLAGLIFLIVFLCLFRPAISGLINRIRRIGKDHIDTTGSQEQKAQTAADPKQVADELLAQINVNQHTREVQQWFETQLQSKNLSIDSETARVLLGYTTVLWIALHFQQIYESIWGTQLELLNFLNSRAFATSQDVQIYYDLGALRYPDIYASYTFEEYINFLRSQLLILTENGEYKITVKGRSFLSYLVTQGLNQNKVG